MREFTWRNEVIRECVFEDKRIKKYLGIFVTLNEWTISLLVGLLKMEQCKDTIIHEVRFEVKG